MSGDFLSQDDGDKFDVVVDDDDDVEDVVDRVLSKPFSVDLGPFGPSASDTRLLRNLLDAHAGGEIEFSRVRGARSEVVRDPAYAEEMVKRHHILSRRAAVAHAIYSEFEGVHGRLYKARTKLEREGGFFEELAPDACRQRLADGNHWVVTRAGAQIRDPKGVCDWREFRYVAGMQVQLPDDDPEAPLVTAIPQPDDVGAFYPGSQQAEAIALVRRIQENHATAACITDVEVWPEEYRKHGLGSLARQQAAAHIREVINPTRRHAVKVLLANMINVRGLNIRVPQIPKPMLLIADQSGREKPIVNKVSILMHALSQRYRSFLGWKMPGKDIPVLFKYKDLPVSGELLVGWDTVAMHIDE